MAAPASAFRWCGGAVVLAAAIAAPFRLQPFQTEHLAEALALGVVVLGLNLFTGWCGQLSLGHGAFVAIGGYTAAVLIADHGWPWPLTLPVATLLCFVVGAAVSYPVVRLRGFQLALVTLGIALVTPRLITRFSGLTGGVQGIVVPGARFEPPSWTRLADDQVQYFAALAVAILGFALARNLVTGRLGRAMRAGRDNELVATAMGVDLTHTRAVVFAISAAYAGGGGAVLMWTARLASPDRFGFTLSLDLVVAVVLGGMASLAGSLIGGLLLVYIPEVSFALQQRGFGFTDLIRGVAVVAVAIVAPGGIANLARAAAQRARTILRR